MSKLRKGIISPIEKKGASYIFEAAGKSFMITGNIIEEAINIPDEFIILSNALKVFKIDESGIEFNYDFNAKSQIRDLNESKADNYNKLVELNEKVNFLKEALKNSKLSNKKIAVIEIESELTKVNENILKLNKEGIQTSFKYDANENKTFIGNREVLTEGIMEHAVASALIKYEDRQLLNLFEYAAKNFNKYNILDFITEVKGGDVTISIMRTPNRAYLWRINEATRIGKFIQMEPHELINYVAEETGEDITSSVQDLLDNLQETVENREKEVAIRQEMISFLHDQRGRLAEADRNIPTIKEADHFLNSEIKRISEEIKGLEEAKLGRDEGYLKATTKMDYNGIAKGTEIMIDSLEYASSSKTDILTVFKGEEPIRIEKRLIELPSSELS